MTELDALRGELTYALPTMSEKLKPFARMILRLIKSAQDGTGDPANLKQRLQIQLRGMEATR